MARKGCHVFRILADLATVLLLIRCNTATSGMRALLCSGHASTSLPSSFRFHKKQDSTDLVTLKTGDWVSPNQDISPPRIAPVDHGSGEVTENQTFREVLWFVEALSIQFAPIIT